jgi:hypothetical protein
MGIDRCLTACLFVPFVVSKTRISGFAFWRQAASSERDHVCATVEKAKHSASEKFFIPLNARSYAVFGRRTRTEFRHDSCNTEQG